MYPDISLLLSLVFIIVGFVLLSWSADKFIDGAAAIARIMGLSPLMVGMVIIGFGTSAPELFVSALAGIGGHSDLSLGNAYGSAIFNIAFILGVAAMIRPLVVKPSVSLVGAPALVVISLFSCLLVGLGGGFSRADGLLELAAFFVLMPLYCWYDQKTKPAEEGGGEGSSESERLPVGKAVMYLIIGLAVLIGSSHILVWGCVDLAKTLGVSDLIIGLTIVAIGTSLPEVASAVVSARKGNHEFVLGNIIGSNFFNILGVVGVAGTLSPFKNISPYLLVRDLPVMVGVSLLITIFGVNWKHPSQPGVIGRGKAAIWLVIIAIYFIVMICQEIG